MSDAHSESELNATPEVPIAIAIAIPTGEQTNPTPDGPIAWWRAMFGPWRYMFRPSKCGFAVSRSPWFGMLSILLGSGLIGATSVLLFVLDGLRYRNWSVAVNSTKQVGERTFVESWSMLATPEFSPVVMTIVILLFAVFWGLVGSVVLGWTLLPMVHRFGGAFRSYFRSVVVAGAVVGPASVFVAAIGLIVVLVNDLRERRWARGTPQLWYEEYLEGGTVWLGFLAAGLLFYWLVRAGIGARTTDPLPLQPLRCDECGYDLTHLSADGRCSECGIATSHSLDLSARRVGVEWETSVTFASWLAANRTLIFQPTAFYQQLTMRKGEGYAFRFAFWNCIAIGVASSVSILGMFIKEERNFGIDEFFGVMSFGFLVPCIVAWAIHIVVGAIACVFTLSWRVVPIFAHVSKVLQYESAFLLVIWGYFMGFTWTLILFDDWITKFFRDLLGVYFFSVELIFVLTSIPALLLIWLRRIHRAMTLTRWSNF